MILYEAAGVESTGQKVISGVVVTLTIVVTIFAGWWILNKMNQAKPRVLHDRRKARAVAKMYNLNSNPSDVETPFSTASSSTTLKPGNGFDQPFNYEGSDVNLPLSVKPQRWDANGRAILDYSNYTDGGPGYAGRPSGAGAPSIPAMGGPPPDIRVIRASGASTMTGGPRSPFDDPSPLPYDTSATPKQDPYRPRPQPQVDIHPRGSGSEDGGHENAPQWAAGMTKEDEKEVLTPLTSAMRQADLPGRSGPPVSRSSYDDVDLYNPAGHRWEQTDGSAGSFHTAQGSTGYSDTEYRPNQYPPATGAQQRQQQQYGRQ